jgi:hypothetical protein
VGPVGVLTHAPGVGGLIAGFVKFAVSTCEGSLGFAKAVFASCLSWSKTSGLFSKCDLFSTR